MAQICSCHFYIYNNELPKGKDDGENYTVDNNFNNIERSDIGKAGKTLAFSPGPAGWARCWLS